MDGSYKLSDRQILEFQANYSYEKLNIDGSNMADVLKNFTEESFGLWTSLANPKSIRAENIEFAGTGHDYAGQKSNLVLDTILAI